ncbi:MAG TPA: acyl-CoA dehydrogenase family protein, partial [Acetobacteraceae bacterium]|nr:acyl-CoA dehydrogenase family protein [Acetobacteraceae bacterium]
MTEPDLLATARRLEPMVAALRPQFDQDRQLPRALVDALHAAGLFRMWLPRALGGAELPPLEFLEVIEELSRQDGSVGWCTVIPAGYGRLSGALDEDAARHIFGAGLGTLVGTLNPTGRAVATPGGYRVSGRWGYGSFIGYGEWVLGNCMVERGAAAESPEFRLCLFPRDAVEVFDVWHVGGLRATGSNDYQVTDLFVPERNTIPLEDFQPPPRRPGPLYAIPMTSTFVSCIATVTLGIARAALEDLVEIGARKRTAGAGPVLRDKPLAQADLARAEATLGAGRAYLFAELGRMWDNTVAGRPVTIRARAAVKLAACHAAQCAIQAVDLAYQSAGGASVYQGSRLERCFRDVHVAGQHVALSMQASLE